MGAQVLGARPRASGGAPSVLEEALGPLRRGHSPSGGNRTLWRMHGPSRAPAMDQILLGDSLELLPAFAAESFQLVYIDPPFNTGRTQVRRSLSAVRDE